MKCLSIQQPYAWAIAKGYKTIENRSWPTSYRGKLAIHAGKSKRSLHDQLADGTPVEHAELVYGAIVAIVDLVDCLALDDTATDPFAEGPYCFILANAVEIEPIPLTGKLGFFEVTIE